MPWLEEYTRNHLNHWVSLRSLRDLGRGKEAGRCSFVKHPLSKEV